ncbi:MAG: hypothetical protein IM638_13635 [Bacteroidetes bacterium]|nr:hypothetical protein [Bacteroidota bacterium]
MFTRSFSTRYVAVLFSMLISAFSIVLLSFSTPAGSYRFLNPEVVTDLTPYTKALEVADMDRYRYMDERNTLLFEGGLKVELLSANEMTALGMPVRMERVRTAKPGFDTGSVFKLTADGVLVEVMTKTKVK